jgi:tetratricopeptide (TPR) repeat protein
MTRHFWVPAVAVTMSIAAAGGARAQQSGAAAGAGSEPREAKSALEACVAAAGDGRDAKPAADEAERQFRALRRTSPQMVEARVGLAQVLIRCQLPHAGMAGIMAVVGEAEAELQAALTTAPDHWDARFTLAMLLKNMPAMLGRASDAVMEFERLLALQGTQADAPHLALPWLHLGEMHESAGRRAAAIETWRRGLALFPGHAALLARLAQAGAGAFPDSAWLAAQPIGAPDVAGLPAVTQVYAFSPLRAEAVNHHFREARSGTTLRRLDVYTMPGGTGEMLQALQAMPGATRAADGAELYIRGGDPAETPVYFDGGRLAFPGRWESLQGSAMGVVDAAVLRRAYFSAGGFSARYGNALSGIVDVETEGRPAAASRRPGTSGCTARASRRC